MGERPTTTFRWWRGLLMQHLPEEPLTGGNVSVGAVRVGDTVRRPANPWSASIDALLIHLERVGFEGAPRALGYDESGRQVLSFVEGYVDREPVYPM
jgi:hypothetical protein